MAIPLALALVIGLAVPTFVLRAAGTLLPRVPPAIAERTAGLAPALLAGLVAIELTTARGVIHFDVKVAAVVVAAVLAALRAPILVSVVAGALTAALLRAVFRLA